MLIVLPACGAALRAQEPCQPPPALSTSPVGNIFTPDEEIALGDAQAQELQGRLRVSGDEQVVSYLAKIGDRLAQHLPASQMHFRYFLVDLSTPNAFSIAGGRIYVSRKMIAFVHSDDELADIVAHEMGHIVTHQSAIDYSRLFARVLGVTSVKDSRDVFDKFRQLRDNWRRDPGAFRILAREEEEHQLAADQVALYAVARAGLVPATFAQTFERLTQVGNKSGGWLSDFFHTTTPDERRLREMTRVAQQIPQSCVEASSPRNDGAFSKWQTSVNDFTAWNQPEALHNVAAKVQLDPPLRPALSQLKFSQDGKYLLAQDSERIYVLTTTPLNSVFDFEAPDAQAAQFTPDSKGIVFHTSSLRVETWDIASRSRTGAFEPVVARGCTKSTVAADGKTLACITSEGELQLMDLPSGSRLLAKRSFAKAQNFLGQTFVVGWIEFSPDGRFLLASGNGHSLGFDVSGKSEVKLQGRLASDITAGFSFLGPDRVIGKAIGDGPIASILEFPAGKRLRRVNVGTMPFSAPTRGNYLLIHPITLGFKPKDESKQAAIAVEDLETGKVIFEGQRPALDICGDLIAGERRDGTVALYQADTKKLLEQSKLPASNLGAIRAMTVSPDMHWLALSESQRAGVWNLVDGTRLYQLRGFDGAGFPGDGYLYSDFPKYEKTERSLARLSLSAPEVVPTRQIDEPFVMQHGPYLVVTTPAHKGFDQFNSDVTREIRDVQTGQTVWTRHFPKEAPSLSLEPVEGNITLYWPASVGAVKGELESFPAVAERLANTGQKKWDWFLEVISLRSGQGRGALLVETGKGSVQIKDLYAQGDWVVIYDSLNEVLVYSLSSGEKKGEVVGSEPVISSAAGLLSVRGDRNQLILYDLTSLDQVDQYSFSSGIVAQSFSGDGRRLFVLTADQSAYFLDIGASPSAALK